MVAASAFVFKDGEKRSDYGRALPDLMDYYSAIRRIGDVPFHVEESRGWSWNGGSFTANANRMTLVI